MAKALLKFRDYGGSTAVIEDGPSLDDAWLSMLSNTWRMRFLVEFKVKFKTNTTFKMRVIDIRFESNNIWKIEGYVRMWTIDGDETDVLVKITYYIEGREGQAQFSRGSTKVISA